MELKELVKDLDSVTNWFSLGLHLGVTPYQLKVLKGMKMSVDYKRIKMLDEWINNYHKPTWCKVVQALQEINEIRLSRCIALKHGEFFLNICVKCQ